MRVLLAGETYSENLGDGVIAETLAFLIRRVDPMIQLGTLDISGRIGWSSTSASVSPLPVKASFNVSIPNRRFRLSWLSDLVPIDFRRLMRWYLLGQRKVQQTIFRDALERADLLVIGGGQLLMDSNLHFPLKLKLLTAEARNLNIPVHFICCGVGSRWSPLGKFLMNSVLKAADKITVRDFDSSSQLAADFGIASTPVLVDPALWSKEVFTKIKPKKEGTVRLGLGIISTEALKQHLRQLEAPLNDETVVRWWIDLIDNARSQYASIELFTNGHSADHELALLVAAEASRSLNFHCTVAPQPKLPIELVQTIENYSAVIAYRLHACIIAMALGLPTVGIEWDRKVRSFFQFLQQEWRCFSFEGATAIPILSALSRAEVEPLTQSLIDDQKKILVDWLKSNLKQ